MQNNEIKLADIQADYQQMYSDMKAFEEAATIVTQERNKLQRDVDALITDLAFKEKQLHQQMAEMTNHQ